jgi:rod shape-determining protein MreC
MDKNFKYSINIILMSVLLLLSVSLLISTIFNKGFSGGLALFIKQRVFVVKKLLVDDIYGNYKYFVDTKGSLKKLENENNFLRNQIRNSSYREMEVVALKKQLELLNASLHIVNNRNIKNVVTTPISLIRVNSFNNVYQITLGKADVSVRNLVINDMGVVGYVSDVYDNYSIVLLITDNRARISGFVGKNINVVVVGDNTPNPLITIYSESTNIKEGDVVNTSGLEGHFPSNIPIGTLYQDQKSQWRIKLFADVDKLQYIHIVR